MSELFDTAFRNDLLNNIQDQQGLITALASFQAQGNALITAIPFSSKRNPLDWILNLHSKYRSITIDKHYEDFNLFTLSFCYRESGTLHTDKGRFFLLAHPVLPKVYMLLTTEGRLFYRKALLPFINSSPRLFCRTILKTSSLQILLHGFQKHCGIDVLTIARASYRSRFIGSSQNEKLFPSVSWPNMDLASAFSWIHEQDGWFSSLTVRPCNNHYRKLSITRQGVIITNFLFKNAYSALLQPICTIMAKNNRLFSNRSRLENADLSAMPLSLRFSPNKFSDTSENIKFIDAMRRLKSSSISVFHGNPYLHMAVIDYYDGSTFDLWVLNSDELVIVPQLKASVFSINRLIGHVFDTYAEGKILAGKEV